MSAEMPRWPTVLVTFPSNAESEGSLVHELAVV